MHEIENLVTIANNVINEVWELEQIEALEPNEYLLVLIVLNKARMEFPRTNDMSGPWKEFNLVDIRCSEGVYYFETNSTGHKTLMQLVQAIRILIEEFKKNEKAICSVTINIRSLESEELFRSLELRNVIASLKHHVKKRVGCEVKLLKN